MIGSINNSFSALSPIRAVGVSNGQPSSRTDVSVESVAEPSDQKVKTLGDPTLTESEEREVQRLKRRDREVRAHERAHMAAGAGVVQGGASFTFTRGPDGKIYAVGGEVKIDTSAENDPDQTIRKMQQVKRAALAPAEPSGTDRAVAARAGQIEARARQEKVKLENAERSEEQNERQDVDSLQASTARRPYQSDTTGQALNVMA
ncbi:putative metalloprotease CJM1_0395 family protein [uncultured Desulfosarcina sp.]|uniref:putative metalloprotease CJM1_0395 family protein n=1 Tax=uncultured Desulfosarcina sp. TaxID=218289 RepID=UPI0029C6C3C1|nr:putative metalloprotease CJM1_0395 family protein [uncultured Desulfosarcina sp.]